MVFRQLVPWETRIKSFKRFSAFKSRLLYRISLVRIWSVLKYSVLGSHDTWAFGYRSWIYWHKIYLVFMGMWPGWFQLGKSAAIKAWVEHISGMLLRAQVALYIKYVASYIPRRLSVLQVTYCYSVLTAMVRVKAKACFSSYIVDCATTLIRCRAYCLTPAVTNIARPG